MYKVTTAGTIVLIAIACVFLLGEVALFFVDFDTIAARIVSHVSVLFCAGIPAAIAIENLMRRKTVADKIVMYLGPLCFIDYTSEQQAIQFCNKLSPEFIPQLINDLAYGILDHHSIPKYIAEDLTPKSLEPLTMVVFRDEGCVRFRLGNKDMKLRGMAKGRYVELELLDDKTTHLLLQHEVGHVILDGTKLKGHTALHHEVMHEVGI